MFHIVLKVSSPQVQAKIFSYLTLEVPKHRQTKTHRMAQHHLFNLGELTLQECNAVAVVDFKNIFDAIILTAAHRQQTSEENELGKSESLGRLDEMTRR